MCCKMMDNFLVPLNHVFFFHIPIGSMYEIITHIWLMLVVDVGKYIMIMDSMGVDDSYYTLQFHVDT